jgi:hypothetical protein
MTETKHEETEYERINRLANGFAVNINKCPSILEAIKAFRIAIGNSRFNPETYHFHGGKSDKNDGTLRNLKLVAQAIEIDGAKLVLQVEG